MSTKTASIIASVVTAILAIPVVVLYGGGGFFLVNGFLNAGGEVYAVSTCLGITMILCAFFAWIFTQTFISSFHWKPILSVIAAIMTSILLGAGMGLAASLVIAIIDALT